MVQPILLGDITGFAALAFIGLSAFLMAFRAKLVKASGGVDSLRNLHVIVSVLAVAFLSLHIGLLFSLPVTIPLDLGYGAFLMGIVLWMSGVGFLERNKDSFFLHGSIAVAVVALVLVHAAASGTNFSPAIAIPALVVSGSVSLLSAGYNAKKMRVKQR